MGLKRAWGVSGSKESIASVRNIVSFVCNNHHIIYITHLIPTGLMIGLLSAGLNFNLIDYPVDGQQLRIHTKYKMHTIVLKPRFALKCKPHIILFITLLN